MPPTCSLTGASELGAPESGAGVQGWAGPAAPHTSGFHAPFSFPLPSARTPACDGLGPPPPDSSGPLPVPRHTRVLSLCCPEDLAVGTLVCSAPTLAGHTGAPHVFTVGLHAGQHTAPPSRICYGTSPERRKTPQAAGAAVGAGVASGPSAVNALGLRPPGFAALRLTGLRASSLASWPEPSRPHPLCGSGQQPPLWSTLTL